jgi:DNA-binding PadR family transcriptional regulator
MTSELNDLVSDFSRFYVLTILYERPSHGYSIIQKFRKRVGKEVSPSLVYPFLQKLQQKGLVKHSIKRVGRKERKIYELTEQGIEVCRQLFKRFAALVSAAIEPSLEVCANCGCKVYEGGYRTVSEGRETAFCCKHCAQAYKREMNSSEGS